MKILLLTLCLYYSYESSLIETQNYALTAFSFNISDVGFMKRFKNCNEWIKWNNEHMVQEKTSIYEVPDKLKSKNVIAVDASEITSKSSKRDWYKLYDKAGNEVVLSELMKGIGDACCDFHLYYMNSVKELKPMRFIHFGDTR